MDGVKRSTDIKLTKRAESRIQTESVEVEPVMQKWVSADESERKAIEAKLANIAEKIVKIYAVNTRSMLRK